MDICLKAREQRLIKIDVTCRNEISWLVLPKLLAVKTGITNMIKVMFVRSTGFLDVTNNSSEPYIFNKDEVLG